MPNRKIRFTREASNVINQELGLHIPSGVYESEKGDLGAIIARYIPKGKYNRRYRNQIIRVAVNLARIHGCEEYEPLRVRETTESNFDPSKEPHQLEMGSIFRQARYDETFHLNPNGKRRR